MKQETLEDVIEDIGKGMVHIELIYPNAGEWIIDLHYEDKNIEDTSLLRAFQKARDIIKSYNK